MNDQPMNKVSPSASPGSGTDLDRRLLSIALVVVLGSFMSILDTTIVNVAIRALAKNFQAPLATMQWVSTAYMLALATVIPVTGWAADRFGTKRLYMTSIALFLAGSALSGAAWSAESLVFFRVLQGLGGGMIMPAGMTILNHASGPQRMGRVMGIVGVPMLLGPILGPILGGWLVDDASWRWIFFINLPVGIVALLAARRVLQPDEPKPHHALDWTGLLLLSPGLAVFVYGLATTAAAGGFRSIADAASVGGGLALLLAFVLHARKQPDALIDVRLFGRRNVGASALTVFLFGAAFFGTSLLLPLYFQMVRGQSAFATGLLLAAQGCGALVTMPIASRITDKAGAGKVVLAGLTLVAAAMFSLSRIGNATPLWWLELTLLCSGAGMGSSMMPAMSAALSALQRHEIARGTSGINIVQRVGASIGTALLAVVLSHQIAHLMPALPGGGGVSETSAILRAGGVPALGQAFGRAFSWSFCIAVMALGAAFFLPRTKPKATAAPVKAEIFVE